MRLAMFFAGLIGCAVIVGCAQKKEDVPTTPKKTFSVIITQDDISEKKRTEIVNLTGINVIKLELGASVPLDPPKDGTPEEAPLPKKVKK